MTDSMKESPRRYSSPLREEQANRTRQRILEAAERLLLERGYARTTIDAIAAAAEVSPQTIYATFKNKRAIIMSIMERHLPCEMMDLYEQSVAANDPREGLRLLAALLVRLREAEGEMMDMLRGAGILSPELANIYRAGEDRQRMESERHIRLLLRHTPLKDGVTLRQAVDISWALCSRDVYRMLVIERGWTADAYAGWLCSTLIATLLP